MGDQLNGGINEMNRDPKNVREITEELCSNDDHIVHQGFLMKWTNYLYGWQKRYVIVSNGAIKYSIDQKKTDYSFSGVISLRKSSIKVHSKDELRFDISISGASYYFRSYTTDDRMIWVNKILTERDNTKIPQNFSHSFSSFSSIGSINSIISGQGRRGQIISDCITEINQMKESIFQQIDTLQNSYDLIIEFIKNSNEKDTQVTLLSEQNSLTKNLNFAPNSTFSTFSNNIRNSPKKSENTINRGSSGVIGASRDLGEVFSHRKSENEILSGLSEFLVVTREGGNIQSTTKSGDDILRSSSGVVVGGRCSGDMTTDSTHVKSQQIFNISELKSPNTRQEPEKIDRGHDEGYPHSMVRNRMVSVDSDAAGAVTGVVVEDRNMSPIVPGHVIRRQLGHRHTKSSSQFSFRHNLLPSLTSVEKDWLLKFLHDRRSSILNNALDFRTTTMGLMSGISNCIEYIDHIEKSFKDELEKEREISRKLHKKIAELNAILGQRAIANSPDLCDQASPQLDEVFYDALVSEIEQEENIKELKSRHADEIPENIVENPHISKVNDFELESLAFLTSLPVDKAWTLVLNDYPTIVFKQEVLIDDIIMDPYRVVHLYHGVSAREVTHFFYDVKYRLKVDSHVDHVFVKANYGDDMVVVHHLHKTIWPAARRDSLVISKRRQIDNSQIKDDLLSLCKKEFKCSDIKIAGDSWIVSNISVDFPGVSVNNYIRVDARVSLLAQTFIKENSDPTIRENYYTLINYSASINPGGWLPHTAVRTLARREFPKFLRNLGSVTFSHSSSQPINI